MTAIETPGPFQRHRVLGRDRAVDRRGGFETSEGNDRIILAIIAALALALCGCPSGGGGGDDEGVVASATAETCMVCHNGSRHDDYTGPGLENPHPFSGAGTLRCTECHGGNPSGGDPLTAHVPPPPQVGDRAFQDQNALAYFNRLTLAGMDKFPDYVVGGVTYTALDYLQFVNPGDQRVVVEGRACGACHTAHVEGAEKSPIVTEVGVFGGARYTAGDPNGVPENAGLYGDTAGDFAFRAVTEPDFLGATEVGAVGTLAEVPVFSVRGRTGPLDIFENPAYDAAALDDDVNPDGSVIPGSPLANLFQEQIIFTCGDCHAGSAGANNRYADFRSSGCSACHMPYALDGRSRSTDPNINKLEPADPDDIDDPERPHVRRHVIVNVAKTLPGGERVSGIDDHTCVGCHQGSNRTVLQYWGIRLDQNQDLRRRVQYPADPVTFRNTANDTRLYDPIVGNRTFNGRNANQYILLEDYDGDGRDDTPPDVHYEAGLGCIDCHGSADLHGGDRVGLTDTPVLSHMEQAVGIQCESCHGTIDAYAPSTPGTAHDGVTRDLAVDRKGNVLSHVVREADGELYLYSRLDGRRHYVPQVRDTITQNGKVDPIGGDLVYNAKAAFAMGRIDGVTPGLGPVQQSLPTAVGFAHSNNVSCVACHASWTNTCTGCHLKGEYDNGNNFSNVTGERIVFKQANADFTYQTPVHFQLGVTVHDQVGVITSNTNVFFQWIDRNGELSRIFTFSDRNGKGTAPQAGGNPHPSLAHNVMMPHSIRGRVNTENEGARYCVACHLTTDGMTAFGAQYDAFRAAYYANDYAALDFELLKQHIGQNPGNQLNSPMWVHMVAGLGSGMFLFDERGAPVNPLDDDVDRFGAEGVAPATAFDPLTVNQRVRLDLDRIVERSGISNASNNHLLLDPSQPSALRDGAADPLKPGPLGARLIRRLTDPTATDGIVLDAWIDADGVLRGAAPLLVDD